MYRNCHNTGFTEVANFMVLFELTMLCQIKYIFLKRELVVRIANNKINKNYYQLMVKCKIKKNLGNRLLFKMVETEAYIIVNPPIYT